VACMVLNQIALRFENLNSPEQLDRTINTLEILTYWNGSSEDVSVECYDLCRRILGSTMEDGMKCRASQIVMQIGFRHSPLNLRVTEYAGWPVTGLMFLEHQFPLEYLDYDSIEDGFSALYFVHSEEDTPWTEAFVVGMVTSLQVDKPTRLKAGIIRFISRFGRQVLNGGVQAMPEEQRQSFFAAMLSKVDMEKGEYRSMDILTYALMSSASRPYLGLEHLTLLETLVSTLIRSYAAYEGLSDAGLISALANENLLDGALLKLWLKILWLRMHIDHDTFHDSEVPKRVLEIKNLFIERPELMEEFRMEMDSLMQNRFQFAKEKLEEFWKTVKSTIKNP
jgi:hypothetical protein